MPAQSALRLEIHTTGGDLRTGDYATVHVRVGNTSATPVDSIVVALGVSPRLRPVGGIGSTAVQLRNSVLQIERIATLAPNQYASWWFVLKADAHGDASVRAIAVPGAAGEAYAESVRWNIADAETNPSSAPSDTDSDPVARARDALDLSRRLRAENQIRDELYALYSARVFMDQAAPGAIDDVARADLADRVRELYPRVFGSQLDPLVQPELPRTSLLTGVVVDKTTQSPLAHATVTLRSSLTDAVYVTTTSGLDGGFQIAELGTDPVIMETSLPGYKTTTRAGFELCPDTITRLFTELEPDNAAARRRAQELRDLAELHGTLTGYTGDGTENVQVILAGADTRAAVTDAQGEFHFTDVTPGDYTFVAQKPGFVAIERRELSVTPGGVVEIQFTLEPER